jgi:hypothetical protein
MGKKIKIQDLRGFVKEALDAFEDGYEGTYYYKLGNSDFHEGDWAIVIGWSGGFDTDYIDDNFISDGNGYEVCSKLAYNDSYMQSDYEWDWVMPYNEETGDVDNTENSLPRDLEGAMKDIDWLLKHWYKYYAE